MHRCRIRDHSLLSPSALSPTLPARRRPETGVERVDLLGDLRATAARGSGRDIDAAGGGATAAPDGALFGDEQMEASSESGGSDGEADRDGTGVKALVPHRDRQVRVAEHQRAGEMDGVSASEPMRCCKRTGGLLDAR